MAHDIMTLHYQVKLILMFLMILFIYHGWQYTSKTNCISESLRRNFDNNKEGTCVLENGMISELRRSLKTKDNQINILNDHNKLLEKKLRKYDEDQQIFTETKKVSDVKIDDEINERFKRDVEKDDVITPNFPDDIGMKAISGARPCCTALKRMTDILRSYMKAIRGLRHDLRECREHNVTEYLTKSIASKSCKFNLVNTNNITSKQFHTDYLTIGIGNTTVYEAMPDLRKPSKLLGRDGSTYLKHDFRDAYNAAVEMVLPAKSQQQLIHLNSIQRFNPLRGIEYIFHIKTNDDNNIYEIPLVKSFANYQIDGNFKDLTVKSSELINIIVPLSGSKYDRLVHFLNIIEEVCVKNKENIFLTFVIYDKRENSLRLKKTIRSFCKEHSLTKFDIYSRNLPFSRGGALHDGVLRWNGHEDTLLFFCDIDITFNLEFLQRCRLNSEKKSKLYFPILFSFYNPKFIEIETNTLPVEEFESFSQSHGKWRTTGFGMICTHKSDYLAVGGFNLKLQGWGGEDTNLYKRFVRSGYSVIRAPDPGVLHRWHPKICDKTRADRKRYHECLGAKARFEGSQRQLGIHLFKLEEGIV